MELQRGMRDKLDKYLNVNGKITAVMNISGRAVYDYCCFGVDADGKLSDDRYMIFYNQTSSPSGEITYSGSGNSAEYTVDLSALPKNINKLVFTASIDGAGTMGEIASHSFEIKQNGSTAISMRLSGGDFKNEKAVISAEIYMKDVWRINAVARGFDGGLGDLLRAYGGEELVPEPAQNTAPVRTAPTPPPVRTAPAPAPVPAQRTAPAPAPAPMPVQRSAPAPVQNYQQYQSAPAPVQNYQQYQAPQQTQGGRGAFAPSSGFVCSVDPSSGYSAQGMPMGPVDTGYRSPNNCAFTSSSGQIDSYIR